MTSTPRHPASSPTPHPPEHADVPDSTRDQIPRDSDELRTHLSLDQPPGERVALLLDYYATEPAPVDDARHCIDDCIAYLDEIEACRECGAAVHLGHEKTCVNHRHAAVSW